MRRSRSRTSGGWPLEHLGEEVARDRPLAAGELRDEPLRVGARGQRDGRQAQPGGPSLRAFVQRGDAGLRQGDPARAKQRARLVEREAQVRRAQLGQLACEAKAVQAQRRVLARRQHHAELRRQSRQQQLEPGTRIARVELVQVVDHEHDRLVELLELVEEPLDHSCAREARRGADALDDVVADRIGERVDQVQPEPLRVTFVALDRNPRHGVGQLRGPRAQQHGLPAPRRCADQCHGARTGRGQALEENGPGNEAIDRGSWLLLSSGQFQRRLSHKPPPRPTESPEVCDDRSHASAGGSCCSSNTLTKGGFHEPQPTPPTTSWSSRSARTRRTTRTPTRR